MIFSEGFERGFRIPQISTRSYFSRSCIIFETDFFFKGRLPLEACKFELKETQPLKAH